MIVFSVTGLVFAMKAERIAGAGNSESASNGDAPSAAITKEEAQKTIASGDAVVAKDDQALPQENEEAGDTEVDVSGSFLQTLKDAASAVTEAISPNKTTVAASKYPWHKDVSTTLFWVGEKADKDNKNISNSPSAWDEEWAKHYGGVDKPKNRSGYVPSGFAPKENPFYFALPYNDFDAKGKHKKDLANVVPWAKDVPLKDGESMLKNRWIRIAKDGKIAYAQWEDVGPFKEDDAAYVFGTAQPASKTNKRAGLDVSPAVNDFLGLSDIDTADWQFVDESDVPDGPWKKTVTTSQVYWR